MELEMKLGVKNKFQIKKLYRIDFLRFEIAIFVFIFERYLRIL